MRARLTMAIVLACAACATACGGGGGSTPTAPTPPTPTAPPGPVTPPPTPIPSGPQVLVGAGDIGMCGSPGADQTGKLLDNIGGTVFTAGDNAYLSGSAQEYRDCYDPFWGRHKSRTRSTPGNHEYVSPGAAPYFQYFGTNAGPSGLGYYSYDLGDWHIVSLNSLIDASASSPQGQWLQDDLNASAARCTLAMWHYPLFTSGPSGAAGDGRGTRDLWRILYAASADVIVNGHDHLFERFAPQDPDGKADAVRGIREFIAGTGGATFYNASNASANSERRITGTFGVLKFTLQTNTYQWEFVPVAGGQSDSGSGNCH